MAINLWFWRRARVWGKALTNLSVGAKHLDSGEHFGFKTH